MDTSDAKANNACASWTQLAAISIITAAPLTIAGPSLGRSRRRGNPNRSSAVSASIASPRKSTVKLGSSQ